MLPKIATVVGTRPEAIKMAPLCRALSLCPQLQHTLISTGQHRSQLDQVFSHFALMPDVDLKLMGKARNLNELSGMVLQEMDVLLEKIAPDLLIVQGDTTTAFAAGLAAYQKGIPVGHVEAGLRSGDMQNPFPEEANRKFISTFATLNFAPTPYAAQNLVNENVEENSILVTGNTVVDALQTISDKITELPASISHLLTPEKRLILVTAHRRESWGEPMQNICAAVKHIVETFDDVEVVFPVHKNPVVRDIVYPALEQVDRIHLTEPLDYFEFISTMKFADLIMSDSGGVQEEAPTFGVPVLIMRTTTERPEVLTTGRAALVGTNTDEIIRHAALQLNTSVEDNSTIINPFGDGKASDRILKSILAWQAGKTPYLSKQDTFAPASGTDKTSHNLTDKPETKTA